MSETLVNGEAAGEFSMLDRGLHYGDGLFETISRIDGHIPLWHYHYERLRRGAAVLRIPLVDEAVIRDEVERVSAETRRAVVKVVITAGPGGRGYQRLDSLQATRLCLGYPYPEADPVATRLGVSVRVCDWRMSMQPALAGIKHLNRLDQVMARAEWTDDAIAEGLMLDTAGQLVEATASNLFVMRSGSWLTPSVEHSGVAGTLRAWLIDNEKVEVTELTLDDLAQSEAVCLGNSVRGIIPVREVIGHGSFDIAPSRSLRACAPIPVSP